MRISGFANPVRTEYYVFPFLSVPHANINAVPMKFAIDTGCSVTSLGLKDAFNLGFITFTQFPDRSDMEIDNVKNLKRIDCNIQTANGIIDSLHIPNCALSFWQSQDSIHTEIVERVLIPLPKLTVKNFPIIFNNSNSLMGLDILQRFKIQFTNQFVYLEK